MKTNGVFEKLAGQFNLDLNKNEFGYLSQETAKCFQFFIEGKKYQSISDEIAVLEFKTEPPFVDDFYAGRSSGIKTCIALIRKTRDRSNL